MSMVNRYALRREANSTQRVAGAVAALQLKVRRHVHQSRAPIAAIVLEAHLHLAEQLEGLRVFFAQQLRNVVCVDHVVHDLAAVARRLTVRAGAVLDGVQGLEVRGRPAVGVVGVEADWLGRVGQVHLFALVDILGLIRLSAHVETRAPIRRPQRGQHLAESNHLMVHLGHSADQGLATRQQLLHESQPRRFAPDNVVVRPLRHHLLRAGPQAWLQLFVLADLERGLTEAGQLLAQLGQREVGGVLVAEGHLQDRHAVVEKGVGEEELLRVVVRHALRLQSLQVDRGLGLAALPQPGWVQLVDDTVLPIDHQLVRRHLEGRRHSRQGRALARPCATAA
mmetsp:Transcript_55015/g.178826  ORF Transcript_55015/g.178826 Transcript_55015/m.178826 type:complete len:338 (-) Transcript_55015:68-1081(-)